MNKVIRVTEMIGKNPKNSQKIIENMGRLCVNFGAQEFWKRFSRLFLWSENKSRLG
jgi:hypothetical protein